MGDGSTPGTWSVAMADEASFVRASVSTSSVLGRRGITALRLGRRYFRELGRHVFFAIGLMTAFLLVLGGSMMPVLDPDTFADFGDGAWWTLVTLSTVGYGELVPQTDAGRAMGFVFVGIAVIWLSLISASIAAFLVGLKMEASSENEERVDTQILHRLDRIEALLERETSVRRDAGDWSGGSGGEGSGREPPTR